MHFRPRDRSASAGDQAEAQRAEDKPKWLTGKHREIAPVPSIRLEWPKTAATRQVAFESWLYVSKQVAGLHNASFKLINLMKFVIVWKSGTTTATNKRLARLAERSVVVMERLVKQAIAMGVLISKRGPRITSNGHSLRSRILQLSYPKSLPDGIVLPSTEGRPTRE